MDSVKLGDRPLNVQKKHNESLLDGGPQDLSSEEEAIFYSRLSKIWKGLMTFPKSSEFEDIISSLPSELWLSRIAEHIPTNVKLMLASPQPPTLARLKSLGSSRRAKAGARDVGDYMAHSPQRGDREGQGGFMRSAVSFSGALGLAMIEWQLRAANGTRGEIGGRGQSSCGVCLQAGPYNPSVTRLVPCFIIIYLKLSLDQSATAASGSLAR
jgi:hypothetical protein